METFLRFYLLFFYVAFVVLVFVLPSIKVFQQTGINPFRFATHHSPIHNYVGNTMKVFILLILLTIVAYAASLSVYQWLVPIPYLELKVLKIAGLILLHLSLLGIKIAQRDMQLSWRIGIDYENKTKLITTGLFSKSRNPVFLFLLISLVGVFLLLPSAVTLAVIFAAYLVLNITMRMEEEFLAGQHGQAFQQYKSKVRRLI